MITWPYLPACGAKSEIAEKCIMCTKPLVIYIYLTVDYIFTSRDSIYCPLLFLQMNEVEVEVEVKLLFLLH